MKFVNLYWIALVFNFVFNFCIIRSVSRIIHFFNKNVLYGSASRLLVIFCLTIKAKKKEKDNSPPTNSKTTTPLKSQQ